MLLRCSRCALSGASAASSSVLVRIFLSTGNAASPFAVREKALAILPGAPAAFSSVLVCSYILAGGGVAERFNAAVLKTVVGLGSPGVRIPPPPPERPPQVIFEFLDWPSQTLSAKQVLGIGRCYEGTSD